MSPMVAASTLVERLSEMETRLALNSCFLLLPCSVLSSGSFFLDPVLLGQSGHLRTGWPQLKQVKEGFLSSNSGCLPLVEWFWKQSAALWPGLPHL